MPRADSTVPAASAPPCCLPASALSQGERESLGSGDRLDMRTGGLVGVDAVEHEPVGPDVDAHRVAVADLAREEAPRERILDLALDGAAQRTRAEDRVVALAAEVRLRFRRNVEHDLSLFQTTHYTGQLHLDD